MDGRNHIIPQGELLGENEIRLENHTYLTLHFQNKIECLEFLARRRLIRNNLLCEACGFFYTLQIKARKEDGYVWKCRGCRSEKSVRIDSFFSDARINLQQAIHILYGWSRDLLQKDIAHEAGVSLKTTIDWCSFCREVAEQHLLDHPISIGGLNEDGTSKVVEIDESKFFHRKYHRGRWREGHWVFGGIERGTGRCFLAEVPNRNAETLLAVVQAHILPGSIIMSDGWRGYGNINDILGGVYEHYVVVHEHNFVDPIDHNVHTQNIENAWMRAKQKLKRQFGTSEALFPSYLYEFIFRNKFRESVLFSEFLICLSQQFPV